MEHRKPEGAGAWEVVIETRENIRASSALGPMGEAERLSNNDVRRSSIVHDPCITGCGSRWRAERVAVKGA